MKADWIVSALAAMGGLSFVGTIISAIAQRRKLKAEEKKTGADAAAVLTSSAVTLLNEIQEDLRDARVELRETKAEVSALTKHVVKLEQLLRDNGVNPPPFRWRSNSRNHHKPAASEGA